jgi:ketosteroid isomerase-like protein
MEGCQEGLEPLDRAYDLSLLSGEVGAVGRCDRSMQQCLAEFLTRQRQMYAGGDLEAVQELLAEDVLWHVPGTSPIAGDYRGREAVTGYFRLRRELAGGAIQIDKRGEAHHEEALVQLADGRATLGGREVLWRTTGVYRVAGGRIAEAWLVPLDQEHFDRVWGATRPPPLVSIRRVRPQECTASTMLDHPRFLELSRRRSWSAGTSGSATWMRAWDPTGG